MILRPVRPQSPCGPPMTKRPVGLIRYRVSFSHSFGSTGLMISSITASMNEGFIFVAVALLGAVLGRQHDGVDAVRLAVDVAHRHLALGVRAQEGQAAVLAQLGLALDQPVRVVDRRRHQLGRFVAGVAEHQALVAGAGVQVVVAGMVDALRDVVALLVVADHHRAALVVDAVLGVVVADALDGVARDLDVVDVRVGGDLAGQHHQAGVAQRLGGDAASAGPARRSRRGWRRRSGRPPCRGGLRRRIRR